MTLRSLVLTSALLLATGLAGCGKVGPLDRPGPLFGAKHGAAAAPDAAPQQQQDPTRPVDTFDPRDRDLDTAPARTVPIPGTNPSPGDSAPPGVLPDPYATPSR